MRFFFRQAMPFSRGLKNEIVYVCISGVAALFFLYLVRPFGFGNLSNRLLLGFGVASIAAALFYVIVSHELYRRYFEDRSWSVGWEIIHSLFFILCVTSAIMIYGDYVNVMQLSWKNFILSLS